MGISVDSQPCKAAWAEHLGIKRTRLRADFWPHGGLGIALGLFREKQGFSERANVFLDENQRVAFVKVCPTSELPDIEEILTRLGEMREYWLGVTPQAHLSKRRLLSCR